MQWFIASTAAIGAFVFIAVIAFQDGTANRRTAVRPNWLLPRPGELHAADIPRVWQGYDPETVELWIEAVQEAYEALYLAAGPTAIARAEHRLAVQQGLIEPYSATVTKDSAV